MRQQPLPLETEQAFRARIQRQITDDICASHHKGNQESVAANRTVAKIVQRARIMANIRKYKGSTCEEIEDETGLSHQSCSARISELRRDGLIRRIGTGTTRSGCNCAVYQAV